ncbi:heme utilization cystosolic carrier protein HutX [Rhodobaculum claviforme]|uniref:Heme iron utilization protein n=1 Tax=Rhodobaculum claviforme TaxID=1549854 RepID=A0A934WJ60_9RHOB|nr:heme utilization cystosolic carrier protein HutX [Rhodobaculum claviforme]MBK5927691.1 heme iron utilization protein [Rhodobaculum claviforme]
MTHPTPEAAAIRAALAATPEAALEDIAAAAGVPPGAVLDHLPAGEVTLVPGAAFVDVMRDLAGWGEVTVVLNTGPVILEAKGAVPLGRLGHGFYNLHGAPIGGHFRAEACARIAFVSRRFMGIETHSVQFHTAEGACMFKVYLGRDAERRMHPDQIARFLALRDRLAAPATA